MPFANTLKILRHQRHCLESIGSRFHKFLRCEGPPGPENPVLISRKLRHFYFQQHFLDSCSCCSLLICSRNLGGSSRSTVAPCWDGQSKAISGQFFHSHCEASSSKEARPRCTTLKTSLNPYLCNTSYSHLIFPVDQRPVPASLTHP